LIAPTSRERSHQGGPICFDASEQGGAILFFDEVDALFGKRSEVKDSHDRYANIEINYLLRRMEDYRGLAILCTNRRAALDRAFLRRLRFLVEFPFPDWQQRRARCSCLS
jgi:SpoVK/Ycf46/Vps4 family AAA+-type ATPase